MPAQRNKYHFVAKNNIERKITIITIEVTPPHQFYPGWLKRSKRGKIYSTCVSFCEVRLLIYHYLGNQQSKDLRAHNYILGYSIHHIYLRIFSVELCFLERADIFSSRKNLVLVNSPELRIYKS